MTAEITLDQVRENTAYNFKTLYESSEIDMEDVDSPFSQLVNDCDYYEPHQFHDKYSGIRKALSYFHLNCRSLSSNWDSFRELLCELHGDSCSFDFIGISEIFNCDKDSRLVLPGYHNIITRCRNNGNGGGVGLFVKDEFDFKIRNDLSVFVPHVFESLFIEIISKTKSNKNLIIGVIYRPNTSPRADFDIFSSTLQDLMDIINNERKQSVFMGDFNIDLLKFGIHEKTNDYVNGIFSRGYMPVILQPTRLSFSTATLIDHIYTNDMISKFASGIVITDVADHFGTFHVVWDKSTGSPQSSELKRIISDSNIKLFKQYLNQTDFNEVQYIPCPNEAYNNFFYLYIKMHLTQPSL